MKRKLRLKLKKISPEQARAGIAKLARLLAPAPTETRPNQKYVDTLCQACLGERRFVPATGFLFVNAIDGDADRMGYCARHLAERSG